MTNFDESKIEGAQEFKSSNSNITIYYVIAALAFLILIFILLPKGKERLFFGITFIIGILYAVYRFTKEKKEESLFNIGVGAKRIKEMIINECIDKGWVRGTKENPNSQDYRFHHQLIDQQGGIFFLNLVFWLRRGYMKGVHTLRIPMVKEVDITEQNYSFFMHSMPWNPQTKLKNYPFIKEKDETASAIEKLISMRQKRKNRYADEQKTIDRFEQNSIAEGEVL